MGKMETENGIRQRWGKGGSRCFRQRGNKSHSTPSLISVDSWDTVPSRCDAIRSQLFIEVRLAGKDASKMWSGKGIFQGV